MELKTYFKDKTVLVAGASGMVGRNLFEHLMSMDISVVGTCFSRGYDDLVKCNFENYRETKKIMEDIDYVFITAAKTYNARTCLENPQSMILPNINIVGNILQAALECHVEKVLYISSATVYQPSFNSLTEDELDWNKDPHDIYMGIGWVKRYIEKLCEFYSMLGLKTLIVRPTNIYGKYDKNDEKINHVIPALILRALNKEDPYRVYGNGLAIKNFIHVDDFIRDMLKVFINYNDCEAINICSNEEHSIRYLVDYILSKLCHGDYKPVVSYEESAIDAVPYKSVNRNKFDSLFGHSTYCSLKEGLNRTIEWFS